MEKAKKASFWLFVIAEILTFGFITSLQFVGFPLFLVFLILMHTGIVLFIISKKRFKRFKILIGHHYEIEYYLLLLYLPLLFYELGSHVFLYQVEETLKIIFTLALSLVSVSISVINSFAFARYLKSK